MRQAMHIFSKDVRHLWPEISIVLVAAAGFAFALTRQLQGTALALLMFVLPIAWAALIARLIYAEPPAGDQPFWVTRPYSRASLLAAKLLFIAVFVNLPKFAGDLIVLRAYGFAIPPELGGLLWSQLLLAALWLLPIAALSTVTTGFVQLISTIVVLGLAGAGSAMLAGAGAAWFGLEWTRSYCAGLVILAAALAIVVWQYARRATTKARFAAAGAIVSAYLVLWFFPWTTAFALQARISGQLVDISRMDIGFDPQMKWGARTLIERDHTADVQIPLRITGIPAGLKLRPEGITATIEDPAGEARHSGGQPRENMRSEGELTSFHAVLGSSFYERVKNGPVRIRGTLYATLYGNVRTAVLPIRDRAVFSPAPGVGLCSAVLNGRMLMLNCRSALRQGPDIVTFNFMGYPRFITGGFAARLQTLSYPAPGSYSPFPADAGLIPVAEYTQAAEISHRDRFTEIRAVALEPVAYIRKDFEITGLRLAEFEPPH